MQARAQQVPLPSADVEDVDVTSGCETNVDIEEEDGSGCGHENSPKMQQNDLERGYRGRKHVRLGECN